MSKKPSNMKRKFSLDIPLLKIGPTKADGRGSREQSASAQDSPPATPKSVRPPLDPKVDHELRLACAYVLQDFKPSHQLYEEHYGKSKDAKPQVARSGTVRVAKKDSVDMVEPLVISKSKPAAQPKEWSIGTSIINDITSEESEDMKPTIKSQAFFEGIHIETNTLDAPMPSKAEIVQEEDEEITTDLSNLEPPSVTRAIESRAFFDGVDLKKLRQQRAAAMQKFEQPKAVTIPKVGKAKSPGIQKALEKFGQAKSSETLPSNVVPAKAEVLQDETAIAEEVPVESLEVKALDLRPNEAEQVNIAPIEIRPLEVAPVKPLRRSVSNPVHTRNPSHGHARRMQGSDSAHTSASTPRTDGSHHWTSSTAPTSAAMTPAKNSARSSAQNVNAGPEKFLTEDIEWMREELERHRKAQEEARAQQELENQVLESLGLETTPVDQQPPTPVLEMALRKQLARAQAEEQQRNVEGVRSAESRARSESRRRRSTPRSESRHELEMLHPDSLQVNRNSQLDPDQPSPRSVQSEIEYYLGTSSAEIDEPPVQSPTEQSDMSRASSRSRRTFRLYGDNGTRAPMASLQASLQGSVQSSKRESRSRSVDSVRSTVSSLAPSIESVSKRINKWRPFHRGQDSSASNESSRPSPAQEKRHTRDFSRELSSPEPRGKTKSPVNLNRELPPLPSLDQWKPVEPSKPKHIASLASPKRDSFRTSDPLSVSSPTIAESLDATSPPPQFDSPSEASSHIQSLSSRYSKPTSDVTEDDTPPYDPSRPPTLSPDILKPAMESGLAISNVADLLPETFSGLKAPEKSNQQQRVPSEYMFRADFAPPVTIPASPPPIPKEIEAPKTIKRRTEDMFRADFDPPVTIPASPPPIPKEIPKPKEAAKPKEVAKPKEIPKPKEIEVDAKPSKRKTEDMFRADYAPPVTVPASPPPIPEEVETEVTTKRKTEDMFLPDLDARARRTPSAPTEESSSSKKAPAKESPVEIPTRKTSKLTKDNSVNYSRSLRRAGTAREQMVGHHGRGPSEPVQISTPMAAKDAAIAQGHARGPSEQVNFSRKPSSDNYSRLYDMGYRNIVPIQPTRSNELASPSPVVPSSKDKPKKWYRLGSVKKKERTWMDEAVKVGSHAGLIDPAAAGPAVPF